MPPILAQELVFLCAFLKSWLRFPEKAPSLIVQVLSMRSEFPTLPHTSESTRQLSLGPDD